MANAEVDITHCPVCFEDYEEQGDHIPRILPCHHTLCENCVKKLLKENSLICPQDRIKHDAAKGFKTFPENQYIITHIQREKAKQTTEFCVEHKWPMIFFCTEFSCNKLICSKCLKDHKYHDFESIDDMKERKYEEFISKLDIVQKELSDSKLKTMKEITDLRNRYASCRKTLKTRKAECLKLVEQVINKIYDKLKQEALEEKEVASSAIEENLVLIEENLLLVDNIHMNTKLNESTVEEVIDSLKTVSDILAHTHDALEENKVNFCFQFDKGKVTRENVRTLFGHLTLSDTCSSNDFNYTGK